MLPESDPPTSKDTPPTNGGPPMLSASEPLPAGVPPPWGSVTLPPQGVPTSSSLRPLLATLLSVFLGVFLLDAVVSLVNDSLILFLDSHLLTMPRGVMALFALLMAVVIYGLMGLMPMIPKRRFLPLAVFNLAAGLVMLPLAIYFYSRIQLVAWAISLCQLMLGLIILDQVQGGFSFRWPLVAENLLAVRRFRWRHLAGFLLVNFFVVLPAVVAYLGFCAAFAVDHFSDGFVALRPGGLTVQVRNYVRDDGKAIQLVPMSHIGESDFYQALSQSFPTNAMILMEGVTDDRNLLTNKITYQRMATALGVVEQHEEFQPRGEMVPADVDIAMFTTNTIGFLNLVMRLHAKPVNAETLIQVLQFSPPHFEVELFDDLLRKRNRHLLDEIHTRLAEAEDLIVPWGAAHMPEIARGIEQAGFRVESTQDYVAIRFRSAANKSSSAGQAAEAPKPK